jgi:atypical dual specificity phosphatase
MLRNFGWVVPGRLAAMGRPHPEDVPVLRYQGFTTVLSLAEDAPLEEMTRAGFLVRHEPIRDFAAPDLETLSRCVAFVRESVDRGERVLVHCHAGYGRTGTVLAAYLASLGGGAAAAIERVRLLRPGSVETPEQEAAVLRFAEREKP